MCLAKRARNSVTDLSGDRHMLRDNITRALSGFEGLLLLFGVLLVGLFAAGHIYSNIYSHSAVRAFWHREPPSARVPVDPSRHNSGIPDFRLWSPKRTEAYQISLNATVPPPLGVLKIPAINLEVPVLEGTDELTLNRAVGHIDGSSAPGAAGNVGIAGHRDGFFRGLKDVRTGDALDLYTENGNARYIVDEILIVPPEDVAVLAPRAKSTLTLVTCYPFYFVGSAPLRYVVHASIASANNLSISEQPHFIANEGGGQDKK